MDSEVTKSVQKNEYPLLAVDGGGTKTIAVIADENGTILAKGYAGTSNYHVAGKEGAKNTLKDAMKDLFNQLPEEIRPHSAEPVRVKRAVFALAGIDTTIDEENVKEIVHQALREKKVDIREVIVENDALSVLLGATTNFPGVLLIAGTGSIAYAHDGKGNYSRAGGFGHRLGDEGGGYWIGKQAISAVLKMKDGRGKDTLLHDLVLQQFGFTTHEQLYNWVYGSDFSIDQVASLAETVENATEKGDEVSRLILEQAVEELYQLVVTAANRVHIVDQPSKLLLLGGVLQNGKFIKENLLEKLKEPMPNMEITETNKEPIHYVVKRGLLGQTGSVPFCPKMKGENL